MKAKRWGSMSSSRVGVGRPQRETTSATGPRASPMAARRQAMPSSWNLWAAGVVRSALGGRGRPGTWSPAPHDRLRAQRPARRGPPHRLACPGPPRPGQPGRRPGRPPPCAPPRCPGPSRSSPCGAAGIGQPGGLGAALQAAGSGAEAGGGAGGPRSVAPSMARWARGALTRKSTRPGWPCAAPSPAPAAS